MNAAAGSGPAQVGPRRSRHRMPSKRHCFYSRADASLEPIGGISTDRARSPWVSERVCLAGGDRMSPKEIAMGVRPPVIDWTRDFDHNHPDWSNDPHAIWDDLRTRCPVAHTQRYRGVYLPVRHDDIRAIAYDTEHFSSRRISILEKPPISAPIPPVTSDPPKHRPE